MQLNKQAIRYFKSKRRGGKNTIARALDIVFGALVLALALFFLFWRMQ